MKHANAPTPAGPALANIGSATSPTTSIPSPGGKGARRADEGEQSQISNLKSEIPPRDRHSDLNEAAKLIAVDVRNSAEWVSHYLQENKPDAAREAYARVIAKLREAHTLIAHHIDNLPTL